jgi:molybdopterin molybdotransferase
MISYEAARAKVIEVVGAHVGRLSTEIIEITDEPSRALGRILAESVAADRNYPPFNRSTRDGYAVCSADLAEEGAKLRLVGESRAGVAFNGVVAPGTCVLILTGAPVPRGADAVVMQEHVHAGDDFVVFERTAKSGQNYIHAGVEQRAGEVVLKRWTRLGYAELAMIAQVGRTSITVTRRPRVAILSTGDEVVAVNQTPGPYQIRNSNSISLAAQVALTGAEPVMLGNAPDEIGELRGWIKRGLEADILLLSGGVSVGKYDLTEQVLRELGAEFFFDAVAMRPGKPAVFGWCHGKPVFGLPGNPVSTMVTFELFAAPAIEMHSGYKPEPLALLKAKLGHPVQEKAPLAHFLPARVTWPAGEPVVGVLLWEGSGDIGAVVRGNCFLVVHETKQSLAAGDWVDVLPRRGIW